MEKQSSRYSWAVIGHDFDDKKSDDDIETLTKEAFLPNRKFTLALNSCLTNISGTLEEMEKGLDIIINIEGYTPGYYCIVSSHEGGNLLFAPVEEKISI